MNNMHKLLEIMAALRDPESGCPWDRKQSFETIVPYTLEEAYEVADSIERGHMEELKDELGDLLFQVVFYAQLASEQGLFEFGDIVDAINDKLVRRHPHVFANASFEDEAELNEAWEQSKQDERNNKTEDHVSILDGVAKALPALKRAQKIQTRAARVGFDWPSLQPVIEKIQEELTELSQAIQTGDQNAQNAEMGDLIFSCVNLSRHLHVDAEESLRHATKKFEKRFNYVENRLLVSGRKVDQCTIEVLDMLWNEAKNIEK